MPKKKLPLSPMLVQYLAGLCVVKWGESASVKNVVLGDMVFDQASGEPRDVDVTVTLDTPDGAYAFMGYEVKHWKKPLSENHVEQLATKLNDMPDVTHRAIVSTSGYYKPAIKKAQYHGVDLFVIKEWTTPLEEHFPNLAPMTGAPEEVFRTAQFLLVWQNPYLWLTVDDAPEFNIGPGAPLFDADGKKHKVFANYGIFADAMVVRSTDILWNIGPVKERAKALMQAHYSRQPTPDEPQWPYGHTVGIAGDEVYLRLPDRKLHRVWAVTILGELRWEFHPWLYCAMERVPSGEMFSGAVVATNPIPGRMLAMIIPTEGRSLQFAPVQLSPEAINNIRGLTIFATETNSPS
ncbi:restriction endonuclease [Mycobacterium intracellulare]|uniref:restriction endonuclease n=1 Tax=Mycobacterium intracellulare TaxID=1767 RepID=UPI0019166D72|nr:restriction endonuclease [Mycobacterium intracellulare]